MITSYKTEHYRNSDSKTGNREPYPKNHLGMVSNKETSYRTG